MVCGCGFVLSTFLSFQRGTFHPHLIKVWLKMTELWRFSKCMKQAPGGGILPCFSQIIDILFHKVTVKNLISKNSVFSSVIFNIICLQNLEKWRIKDDVSGDEKQRYFLSSGAALNKRVALYHIRINTSICNQAPLIMLPIYAL